MVLRRFAVVLVLAALGLGLSSSAQEQQEKHRKYKPPPETTHLQVQVLKDETGKPIENASVVFHPLKDGEDAGNMETKTGPDGITTLDLIPTGSVVRLQVLANGFATYGGMITLDGPKKFVVVRMLQPQHQVSIYGDHVKGTGRVPGVREPDRKPEEMVGQAFSSTAPVIKLTDSALSGTISGRVTDAKGLAISDAKVTIKLEDGSGPSHGVRTTDDGRYAVVNLPAGVYSVDMEATGYRAKAHSTVTLKSRQNMVLNRVLKVQK